MSTSTRLPAVDGLRAVAALWVVLFHISALSQASFPQLPGLDLFMRSGSTGVSLFLVLSGFCLFLPFAHGRTARFKSGEFFRRRLRRLAPAYYVSLVGSLILALITAGPLDLPQLTLADGLVQLVAHLTLVHSLFPDTFYALNGAYWSLGLEWQLYLGLPLLVLGIRRYGLLPVVAFAVGCNLVYRIGLAVAISRGLIVAGSPLAEVVLPNQLFGRWAEFALGMLAAELYASGRLQRLAAHARILIGALLVMVPLAFASTRLDVSHVVYGCLFCMLLCITLLGNNVVSRVLGWRPLVAIGTLSYSLYLVHQPIIQSVARWLTIYHPTASPTVVFLCLVPTAPGILALAWLLHVTVERRTMGPTGASARSALLSHRRHWLGRSAVVAWLTPPTPAVPALDSAGPERVL